MKMGKGGESKNEKEGWESESVSETMRENERRLMGKGNENENENVKIYLLRVERYFNHPTVIKQMTANRRVVFVST